MILIWKQLVIQMLHNNDKLYDSAILCLIKKCLSLTLSIRITLLFINKVSLKAQSNAQIEYNAVLKVYADYLNLIISVTIFI